MSKNKFGSVFSEKPLKDHVEEYKKAQKEAADRRAAGGGKDGEKYPVYLNLKDGESREILFLDTEPVTFDQHRVWDNSQKEGRGGWRVFSCTREPDCPLCVAGNRASAKFAWQVVDVEHLDKDNNPVPRVKLWVRGVKFAEMLYRKAAKYNLLKETLILERVGGDQTTQYTLERSENKTQVRYAKDEVIDLQDYFGLDDEKYKDMLRLAADLKGSSGPPASSSRTSASSEPSKGRRSKLEDDDEDGGPIPF